MNIRATIVGAVGLSISLGALSIPLPATRPVGANTRTFEKDKQEPMTPENLLNRLRRLKTLGLDVRGEIPEGSPAADNYADLINQRIQSRNGDMSGSDDVPLEAGKLRIYVVRTPSTWDYRTNQIDRYLHDLEGPEWIGLFRDTLRCPMGIEQSLSQGESTSDLRERYKLAFQQSIPHHPLLGRVWDTYADASYEPAEINQLRDECLSVRASTSNATALEGLDKLIHACNEALESDLGLYLASD